MTPLAAALAARIARDGPLTVADYMAAALNDPEHGYYRTRDPLGLRGDFTTAPEVSQMFGELIGIWCLTVFERLGAPARFRLVELGPGRGTLMADLWRAAKIRPAFAAAEIHLVETSPVLRRKQEETLKGLTVRWHADFAAVAGGADPLIVIANEFFDAMPVHQLEMTPKGWRERLVAFDPASKSFHFIAAAAATPVCELVPPELAEAEVGAIFEISPEARKLMSAIAAEIVAKGGAALVIDYGHRATALGETLQAVRGHCYYDVLADPGGADITAHVDFAALAVAARAAGAQTSGPVSQAEFLRRLGIVARAKALMAAQPARTPQIVAGLERLIDADKMGSLFKVLMAASPALGPLEGTGAP